MILILTQEEKCGNFQITHNATGNGIGSSSLTSATRSHPSHRLAIPHVSPHPFAIPPFLLNPVSHVRRDQGGDAAEPQNPRNALVVGAAPRLLRDLEDGTAHDGGKDLRGGDGDVVQTEDDPCLVFRRGGGGGGATGFGFPFGDFVADEGEGGPEGEGPWDADYADEHGGGADGRDEKCGEDAEGEK